MGGRDVPRDADNLDLEIDMVMTAFFEVLERLRQRNDVPPALCRLNMSASSAVSIFVEDAEMEELFLTCPPNKAVE